MGKQRSQSNGDKEIGNRVRKYREKKHFTQKKLAESAMVSQSSITRLERGESMVSVFTLLEISKALEVSVSDILLESCAPENGELSGLSRKLEMCSPEQRQALIRAFEQIADALSIKNGEEEMEEETLKL